MIAETRPATPNALRSISFIIMLRSVAAPLVVWDHLIASWLDNQHQTWLPLTYVRQYVTTPLGIIQDFGFFGVVLFFLISGFIITYVGQREERKTFGIKRLLRIYPPLIVSILVTLLAYNVQALITKTTNSFSTISIVDVIWAMSLLNYVRVDQNPVNGVAWTLVIEMIFYTICWILLPWLRTRPRVVILFGSFSTLAIMTISHSLGPNFFLFAVSYSYIPFLVTGQITYFVWSKQLRLSEALVLGVINYFVLIHGIATIYPAFVTPGNSYGVSYLYATSIFVGLASIGDRLRVPSGVRVAADVSYSLYLFHGVIGFLILNALYPTVPFTIALTISLCAVGIFSYGSWLLIERPSQQIARWMLEFRLSPKKSISGIPPIPAKPNRP